MMGGGVDGSAVGGVVVNWLGGLGSKLETGV